MIIQNAHTKKNALIIVLRMLRIIFDNNKCASEHFGLIDAKLMKLQQ